MVIFLKSKIYFFAGLTNIIYLYISIYYIISGYLLCEKRYVTSKLGHLTPGPKRGQHHSVGSGRGRGE